MASPAAHVTAFLFLFPTGLCRLFRSSSLYLQNPSLYASKSCYLSNPKYKNLHLYILCIALPIASFSEFFLFLTLSAHPTYTFSLFHQCLSLFFFWVLLILFISREFLDPSAINDGLLFVYAAIAFLVEYSAIGKGVAHFGVGGVVYDLLGKLTLVCAGCCFVLSLKPASFWADFVLSCGLVFKGTWVLQAGLNLYTDVFGFKGCRKITVLPSRDSADVVCDLKEDGLRGVALVNLLFVVHAILILVLGLVVFGLLSSYKNLRCDEASGPLLAELNSESIRMLAGHADLEIE
ncbi:DUF716 domain-containing protein [Cephalotus follicularis]|uniref:DUF716 domain-containing protein n=1 Tax=Cephalotus follicularis TaxID=3775 RepID=A0A1Q3BRH6_CEPFO|nr:DUF716 domain-containing protein [Cephalotus follicularis]